MVDGVLIPVSKCSCITIDFWGQTNRNVLAAFLTHAHADHIQGLKDSWNEQVPIYCSYATSRIIVERFPGLQSAFRILQEESTTLLKLASPVGAVTVHVTAYNANHCLGSLMFLLEGPFGMILHTGDFRWEADFAESMLSDEVLTWAPIDKLYIDNTYAHPRYTFPSRADACEAVLDLVSANPDKAILIGVDRLGKEELLAAIAAATGERVCVPAERWALLVMLGLPVARLFTTDTRAARIHAVLRHAMTLKQVALANRKQPTIAILPSGASDASASAITRDGGSSAHTGSVSPAELEHASRCTFQVPYSLHCNYTELRSFIAALRPRQVIPTVTRGVEAEVPVGLDQLCTDAAHDSAPGRDSWGKPPPLAAVSIQVDCSMPRYSGNATPQESADVALLGGDNMLQMSSSDRRRGHSSWQSLWCQASEQIHTARKEGSGTRGGTRQAG